MTGYGDPNPKVVAAQSKAQVKSDLLPKHSWITLADPYKANNGFTAAFDLRNKVTGETTWKTEDIKVTDRIYRLINQLFEDIEETRAYCIHTFEMC